MKKRADITPPSSVLSRIHLPWDQARTEYNLRVVHHRRRVRRQRWRAVAAGGSVAAGLVLIAVLRQDGPTHPAPSAPELTTAPPAGRTLVLADGTRVALLDGRSKVSVEQLSAPRMEVRLAEGGARFSVRPDKSRTFTVHAGRVLVRVLGTEFVTKVEGTRTFVHVYQGSVNVIWESGSATLAPGQSGRYPPEDEQVPIEAAAAEGEPRANETDGQPFTPAANQAPLESKRRKFRQKALGNDPAGAFRILKETPNILGSTAADLMLAADVARRSGHPAQAVPYLQRVIREYRADSQAPLAAFTLGRIYLGHLRHPGDAADAFAEVRRLAPQGPLSEDALAREAEASWRAGQTDRARQLADRYVTRYPGGRRASLVNRYRAP